jgi:starvation-inducible DNA-binding protein
MSDLNIGLTKDQRLGVTGLLRALLADEYVLYTKTRKYHWNVEGPHFNDLHKFFESQYDEIDEAIDEVAERIRAIGEYSPGSMATFLADARLKEDNGGQISAPKMIANLLADHEALVRSLREDLETAKEKFNDAGNQDFFTGLLQVHEKAAWMLRSMLAKG